MTVKQLEAQVKMERDEKKDVVVQRLHREIDGEGVKVMAESTVATHACRREDPRALPWWRISRSTRNLEGTTLPTVAKSRRMESTPQDHMMSARMMSVRLI